MARATLLTVMILFLASVSWSQFGSQGPALPWQQETGAPQFFGDYANFWMDDTLTYTEIYFQVPFSQLRFVRAQQKYRAAYEIDLHLQNSEGNSVYNRSARDDVEVADYEETATGANTRVSLFSVCLKPGVYHLRAIVTDRTIGKSSEAKTELYVRDFTGPALSLSDLQFSRNIEINPIAEDFVKNGRRVEPNVRHVYSQTTPNLCAYYEVYNLAFDSAVDSFRTTFTILGEDGRLITRLTRYSRKPGTSCVQSFCLPVADSTSAEALTISAVGETAEEPMLGAGTYRLVVEVSDEKTGQHAETSGTFAVYREHFSFSDYSFDELLEQLRYIAGDKELRHLEKLEMSQQQQALAEFWKQKDPTPGTAKNELMEEYYRRVRYADLSFKTHGGPGWRAPQGMVYIVYGPPDRIQRILSTFSDPAYEVWEYRQHNRRFVFAEIGKDMYKLLDPISFNDFRRRR